MADTKLFGSWIRMGQVSEDWFIASIAETTKRLLEQMHKSVEPEDDISLIFKLNPIGDDSYSVTGAWKCHGIPKGSASGMIDREKVIRDLEYLISFGGASQQSMVMQIATEAYTLLKEQEPVKPAWRQGKAYCGQCGQKMPRKCDGLERRYCSFCGRKVKWE